MDIKNLTKYFRQSLIDSERLSPTDKDLLPVLGKNKFQNPKANYIAIDNSIWLNGYMDQNLSSEIISNKQVTGKPELTEIELVLFPRVDLLLSRGGEKDRRKRQVLLPLVIFVRLNKDGELKPSNKSPWIPREWLGPTQSAVEPIGELAVLDDFFTQNPYEGIESWQQLVDYSTDMLCYVIGVHKNKIKKNNNQADVSLFDLEVHPEYQLNNQCIFQTEMMVIGAKAKMLKVLDRLIELKQMPKLYECFCSQSSPELEKYHDIGFHSTLAQKHIGQMTGEFPLSGKQRNALHHFFKLNNGEILAVNGPPGTGKTTLIRSVVSNLWTQAALDETEPPLIVATSNNNQAVTNILESFAKVDEEGLNAHLKGRWLPEINSYGLYCCARGKANEKNPYMYLGPNGEGCMERWHTLEYLNCAVKHFMSKAKAWYGNNSLTDIVQTKKILHKALKKTQLAITDGIKKLDDFQQQKQSIIKSYGSIEALNQEIENNNHYLNELEKEYGCIKICLDEIYQLWDARSLWIGLMMWVPPVRKKEQRKTARFLNNCDIHLDSYKDKVVEAWFIKKLQNQKEKLNTIQQDIDRLSQLKKSYELSSDNLNKWIHKYQPKELFSKSLPDMVNEINDRVLRFTLFKLATHYWEARWILELKAFFHNKDSDKKSPAKVLRKLKRFAKLTPCFVSTFYMVPSTFMGGAYHDNIWKDIPLFSEIDLLIVDEAGQALPEVSSASFSLAKRALIVGDTDQIEPVWNVPGSVDRGNLKSFDLLHDEIQYNSFWLQSGLLASSGNLMRVAQRQSRYHQFHELQRGLYLTEHRRCYDSIINYCNELVYKGILEPLRGEPEYKSFWGTMSMVPVLSDSQSFGGSRGNIIEARQIANWLTIHYHRIVRYAKHANPKLEEKDDSYVLRLSVGIVTPFSKQARLIRSELYKQGLNGLTVGTVHSLQGDERFVVIFSSVYGENDHSTGKFYDSGPNMLNVAVSRAKNVFIVFGHPEIFGTTNRSSPSGILRSKLELLDNDYENKDIY